MGWMKETSDWRSSSAMRQVQSHPRAEEVNEAYYEMRNIDMDMLNGIGPPR